MSVYLLDANVLIALSWPGHESHALVQRWFGRKSPQGWATCPFTEAAFVRIVSNPAFSPHALNVMESIDLLKANREHRGHRFWEDSIGYPEAVESLGAELAGHQQVTDAYLLGLALRHRGKLATLDRSLAALLPKDSPHLDHIELVSEAPRHRE